MKLTPIERIEAVTNVVEVKEGIINPTKSYPGKLKLPILKKGKIKVRRKIIPQFISAPTAPKVTRLKGSKIILINGLIKTARRAKVKLTKSRFTFSPP